MSELTPFAGLEALGPGEPLDEEFLTQNPRIIDALLRVGAISHRHDGHAALANPDLDPVADTNDAGGTIPADQTVYIAYTLVDLDGGETIDSPSAVVTTQAGLVAPDSAPGLTVDTTAGTLLIGNYYYALSVTDGAGGETVLGPTGTVTIDPGSATNQIQITGLADILAGVAGGVTWRLWRAIDGGEWQMINEGATDTFTDDGSHCVDCGVTPPTAQATNGTNQLLVTVPAPADVTRIASFNIYASIDGTFTGDCLLGNFDVAQLGVEQTFNDLTVTPGRPPEVSNALAGANRLNADDILGPWKSPVATEADLPVDGNTDQDIRMTKDDGAWHRWLDADSSWHPVGGGGGGGNRIPLTDPLGFYDADNDPSTDRMEVWVEKAGGEIIDPFDVNIGYGNVYHGDGVYAVAGGYATRTDAYPSPIWLMSPLTGADFDSVTVEFQQHANGGNPVAQALLAAGTFRFLSLDYDMVAGTLKLVSTVTASGGDTRTDLDTISGIAAPPLDTSRWLHLYRNGDQLTGELYAADPATNIPTHVIGSITIPPDFNVEGALGWGMSGDAVDQLHVMWADYSVVPSYSLHVGLPTGPALLLVDENGNSDFVRQPSNVTEFAGAGSPGFSGDWGNQDATVGNRVGYWVDGEGNTRMRGLAEKGSAIAAGAILTLPAAVAPKGAARRFACAASTDSGDGLAFVEARTDGTVYLLSGPGGTTPVVSLEQINFRP